MKIWQSMALAAVSLAVIIGWIAIASHLVNDDFPLKWDCIAIAFLFVTLSALLYALFGEW